jgi:hypothetical protein
VTRADTADPTPSRAEQRAREKAERAEWDHLIDRLGVLWPTYDCFCGTLDDLRQTVADLEHRAARDRPRQRGSDRDEVAPRAVQDDPQTAARVAVTRAQQRLQHSHHSGRGDVAADVGRRQRGRDETAQDVGGEVDD